MTTTQWGPSTAGLLVCGLLGAALGAGVLIQGTDAPGRVLAGIAAVGLLAFAALSWRARPKLAITPDGLAIRGWFRRDVLGRDVIANIRITEFRRIARTVRLLEIDVVLPGEVDARTDERLVVFTRWDLGTDPLDVLDALTTAGYAGRSR